MDEQAKKRKRYSDEFKQDAVRLVVEEGYTIPAASRAVGFARRRCGAGSNGEPAAPSTPSAR